MQVSASTQGGAPRPSSAYHACRSRLCRPYALRCRAGVHARREVCIGLTLWFCVSAAPQGRGGLRQPGRVLARSCAAPLSRLTPTAPLTGEPFRRQFPQSLPCKGRWVRRKAQTEGALPVGGGDIRKGPAGAYPVFRRGRCWHRPANLAAAPGSAAGEIARPTKRPQAGGDAEAAVVRQVRRRADASIGPYAGGAGECGRPEGYWRGKVRHPSVACGDTSPCRGGFWGGSRLTVPLCRGSVGDKKGSPLGGRCGPRGLGVRKRGRRR